MFLNKTRGSILFTVLSINEKVFQSYEAKEACCESKLTNYLNVFLSFYHDIVRNY